MIGGHLVPPPRAVGDDAFGIVARRDHQPARARERGVAIVLAELRACPAHEFIDIAVIVGEQDEALDVFGRGAGVMPEPREREIGTRTEEHTSELQSLMHISYAV